MSKNSTDYKELLTHALLSIRKSEKKNKEYELEKSEAIAIVGVGCKLPGEVNSLEDFHNLLSNKQDAIIDIPEDRWDTNHNTSKESTVKKGGIIKDVSSFDASFFKISPLEASYMDPQQRLLLELAWESIENANILPENLHNKSVGVFMGVSTFDYLINTSEENEFNTYAASGNSYNILAGRIAYYLGLKGPCLGIDTACSSSLTAIHYACESLRNKECELALTGGVNLLLSQSTMAAYTEAGILSPDNRCHTFDASANGYVRSEGAGIIVLKRMSDAIKDGDEILAKIKGSAINHNGASGGMTVPNGTAQKELIKQALKNARMSANEIDYIEAHGTGTSLGDPIEMNALNEVFNEERVNNPLLVGSVKTNIGHMEAASGIAGVLKLLTQLQNEQIYPHLHLKKPNPLISWDSNKIQVPTKAKKWMSNGKQRSGGVSSFGINGSNAHIIIEEHQPDSQEKQEEIIDYNEVLIVLSAKNEERLNAYAIRFLNYLNTNNIDKSTLIRIAYTLQKSRTKMKHRVAFLVKDKTQLKEKLELYIKGKKVITNCFLGKEINESALAVKKDIDYKNLGKLANLWVKGTSVNWNLLYKKDHLPSMIGLPSYPFAKEHYWIPLQNKKSAITNSDKLHPLLHSNESDLNEQKYTSVYTGTETFLTDHVVVDEKKVLPGVAYLELARAAGELSAKNPVTQIRNVTWLSPISVNEKPETVHIRIYPLEDSMGYEVYNHIESKEEVHNQGKLVTKLQEPPKKQNLENLKKQFTQSKNKKECYDLLKSLGLNLGASFQGIETLWYNDVAALSKITLPKEEGFVLTAGVLDSALQTCTGLNFGDKESVLQLPFSVKEVNIYGELPESVWCYVQKNKNTRDKNRVIEYDIDLLNELGEVLIRFKDFVAMPKKGFSKVEAIEKPSTQFYSNEWIMKTAKSGKIYENQLILLVGGSADLKDQIRERLEVDVENISGDTEETYFINVFEKVREKLLKKTQVHITLVCLTADYLDYSFVSGLLKSANLENPKITGKIVGVENFSLGALGSILSILEAEQSNSDIEVCYINGSREVKKLEPFSEMQATSEKTVAIKEGGVYLITGGFGGLGKIFSTYIGKTKNTKIILTGRSGLTKERETILSSLQGAEYHICDISNKEAVELLIEKVKKTHGKLDGVIHSAGIVQDSIIRNKTISEIQLVLAPKILGTKNLDEATKDEPLDFMVFFSSISSVLGNIGQSDYASANAYLNNYAEIRKEKSLEGKRYGKTLSINWPLWKDGGMQVSKGNEELLEKHWGMFSLPTDDGILSFEKLLRSKKSSGIVTFGVQERIVKKIVEKEALFKPKKRSEIDVSVLQKEVTSKIIELASSLLKLDVNHIELDEELGDYGFDSILFTRFNNELNAYYDLDLMPTVFYNYSTIKTFVEHLVEEHLENLLKRHDVNSKKSIGSSGVKLNTFQNSQEKKSRFTISNSTSVEINKISKGKNMERIAIVGMSGRFPGSPDLNTFWNNIKENKDLIKEIPKSRWDWKSHYGDPHKEENKTKVKWGGFIEDVDKFDPLFFSISPLEAEFMDPQQRIVLEAVYHALEDGGISPTAIRGTNTGIFVGVGSSDYSMLFKGKDVPIQPQAAIGSAHSILVNRISYLLDLHGPSVPIDTACSSSLVAIHQAVEQIRNGHCDMAIAGGVNVLLAPELTISFSKAGMLSEDGRCKTFDERANGYVRSEGVGVVILKPLSKAEADGDHIYGVIRGIAENHGGKANTLTSPNPNAQKELLLKAYRSAGISPNDVSYIEAHGTGTPLGDPVEIEGLKLAFEELYKTGDFSKKDTPHCGIGSVKTNIGHLEAGAGMPSIIKVLLSMKHKTLAGNVHLETPNKYLRLDGSPFYLQEKTKDWSTDNGKHRIAGVSSFGFGGANAHVIIEEYISKEKRPYISNAPAIIILSAKNEERLKKQVSNLRKHIETNPDASLYDIAYTLQVGREAMDERLTVIVNDLKELKSQLEKYAKDQTKGFLKGNAKKNKNDFFLKGNAGKSYIEIAIKEKELESLAQLWIKGISIDWKILYEEGCFPNKISLPTYPFIRKRCWVYDQIGGNSVSNTVNKLHPLLHINESSLKQQKYTSTYEGTEIFLADHVVNEEKILPGVAYLELARAAGELSTENTITQLRDVVWLTPVKVNGSPETIHIKVSSLKEGAGYEIYSHTIEGEEQVHSQGKLLTKGQSPMKQDLEGIRRKLTQSKKREECYSLFKEVGFNYGLGFRGIEELWYSNLVALSKITLPKEEGYILSPGMLDSALQTSMGLVIGEENIGTALPFSVKEVNIYGELPETIWCYARKSANNMEESKITPYDIDLLNESGDVLLNFKDFVSLPTGGFSKSKTTTEDEATTQFFSNDWIVNTEKPSGPVCENQLILLAGGTVELSDQLREKLEVEVLIPKGESEETYFTNVFDEVKTRIQGKTKINITVVCKTSDYLDYGFISGLLKSASQENPLLTGKVVGLDNFSIDSIDTIVEILEFEQSSGNFEVRYTEGIREVKSFQLLPEEVLISEPPTIKEDGVYLITGGFGGLGLIFAEHISKTKGAKVILTGRSKLTKEKEIILSSLPRSEYYVCDVANKKSVIALVKKIKKGHGKLDGIVHSAGVIRDSFIINKTKEELQSVLSSKILGTKNLDEATKEESLDFMVLFSSTAGVFGNVGQSDYASANSYLDNYAVIRNEKSLKGERHGKTLSINWPLWKEGGMHIDEKSEELLEKQWGMKTLPTVEGINAFETLIGSTRTNGIVIHGYQNRIAKTFLEKKKPSTPQKINEGDISVSKEDVKNKILEIVATLLKLDVNDIDFEDELGDYGFDSILLTQFSNTLNAYYDLDLIPTVFYNYPTIEALADFLVENHFSEIAMKDSSNNSANKKTDANISSNEQESSKNGTTLEKQALLKPMLVSKTSQELVHFYMNTGDASKTKNEPSVFIIPGMPGVLDGYYELAEQLLPYGNVYGLAMKGTLGNSKALNSIEEMAKHNITMIQEVYDSKPVCLIAHSYGGLIAYEMIQQMKVLGIPVSQVILIDSSINTLKTSVSERITLLIHCFIAHLNVDVDVDKVVKKIVSKPVNKRGDLVCDFFKSLGIDIEFELFNKLWNLLETSMKAKYKISKKLDVPATLVRPEEALLGAISENLGWNKYYTNLKEIESSGNHFSSVNKMNSSQWLPKISLKEIK